MIFGSLKGGLGKPRNWPRLRRFMVSDRNSFMNGELIIVDGGAVT